MQKILNLIIGKRAYKLGIALALFTCFVLFWMNGAVGIIGSEDNPANLLYAGVILIAIISSLIAWLEPIKMSRAMIATATAQFIVPIVAIIIWSPSMNTSEEIVGIVGIFILNTIFTLMFATSACLFKRSKQEVLSQ